LLLIHKLTI